MAKNAKLQALSGGEDPKPKKPSELKALMAARAEADAKSFALRRGLLTGEATHTGGVVPKVTFKGQEIPYGAPIPELMERTVKYHPVPRDITEFQTHNGIPYFIDPRDGDMKYFDPAFINLPQFKRKA
jgi:hypothetical protein